MPFLPDTVFVYPWVMWLVWLAYGLTIVGIIAIVVSENRNPLKSLAWVTVLLLLPVVGIILYVFFGRNIRSKHMLSRRDRRRLSKINPSRHLAVTNLDRLPLPPEWRQQAALARNLASAQYYPGNSVQIFTNGTEKFEALLDDLRKARHTICLQYYIFVNDEIGTKVADILREKARAGVKVRVIYDHVGSWRVPAKFFKAMRADGVEVFPFFRVSFTLFASRINWRNHRKVCIIDGTVGYIGGFNIADRYITGGKQFKCWRDTHARVTGPAVTGLLQSFALDWYTMGQSWEKWQYEQEMTASPANVGTAGIQTIVSGPTSQWANIAFIFHRAVATARQRILIQTPYFLPTESLLKALQEAALSGVDVRIMLPRKSDSDLLRFASFSYVSECLRAGIKFYLYDAGMLHAKTMVIDDEFSTIGSTNFDFRSFEHNFEGNIIIYSSQVNKQMQDIFYADMRQCTRVRPNQWARRPLMQKTAESLTRLLSPIL